MDEIMDNYSSIRDIILESNPSFNMYEKKDDARVNILFHNFFHLSNFLMNVLMREPF